MSKKVLYIICEGSSDRATLYLPLKNCFAKHFPNIEIKVTHGDIVYKDNCTEDNAVGILENYIREYLDNYGLRTSEIVAVVQLIDTDGAFSNTDILKQSEVNGPYQFKDDGIYVNDIESVKQRFIKKTKIYKKLIQTKTILNIPYLKFFVSRNLEHAFYNEIDLSEAEKMEHAFEFSDTYENKEDEFKEFLNGLFFESPKSYNDSWNFIFKDNNSIKRCSNLYLLFDKISAILQMDTIEARIDKLKAL